MFNAGLLVIDGGKDAPSVNPDAHLSTKSDESPLSSPGLSQKRPRARSCVRKVKISRKGTDDSDDDFVRPKKVGSSSAGRQPAKATTEKAGCASARKSSRNVEVDVTLQVALCFYYCVFFVLLFFGCC